MAGPVRGWRCLAAVVGAWSSAAIAADAGRGAGLYLQLPSGVPSCVGCHGPDPAANRNNLLRAADQPQLLLKTLNAVGVMGYLKTELGAAEIDDLAAYLGGVARVAASTEWALWPRSVEFGTLELGAASPAFAVLLRNTGNRALTGIAPRLSSGVFSLEHDCSDRLAPGAECVARLRALAAAPGGLTDALIWGAGAAGSIVGVSATVSLGPTALLSAGTEVLDFGAVEVGTSTSRALRLRNAGTAPATLGVSTLTGPGAPAFDMGGSCGPGAVVPPGADCTVAIRFRPGAVVRYEAALQWRSDGANPAPVTLHAAGASSAAPPALPPAGTGVAGNDGGGGCAAASATRGVDPTLLLLVAAGVLGVAARRGRRRRMARTHDRG